MRRTILAVLAVAASLPAAVPAAAATPFYAVDREYVDVPAGVMPWDPSFSPDGRHIVFQDDNAGFEWMANADGTGVRCLTCDMADHPEIVGGFTYVFPDNKRMFLSNELGDLVYVLECAPSLFACESHQWLPVDLSGDAAPSAPNLGRRTYHLAPDGRHLGYTITRPDGLVMLVARLERRTSDYGLVDYHVVNPVGPSGPADTDPAGWNNGGSLDELKSFADGGRSIIALTEPSSVPQQVKIDLATGKVTQLTAYPDWTEDGAFSPDGSMLLSASWRTQNRLTALAQVPVVPSFIALPADAIIGIYYVSSRPGFSCDIVPWLLPAEGDAGGTLIGQPLNPYGGGTTIPANNLAGQQVWSPDSTRVLLQGRSLLDPPIGANDYLLQKGPAPNRLMIARVRRRPTKPVPAVTTEVGDWAPTPTAYRSSFDMPGTHVVQGRKGGTATFTINGNIVGGEFTAIYQDYSDDGAYVLNGTQTVHGSVLATTVITDDLTVTDASGKQVGRLEANLTFSQIKPSPPSGQPGVRKSGTVTSTWMGRTVSGIPEVAPCPKTMPRRPALAVEAAVRRAGRARLVTATVTAGVAGDVRPVQGARVRIAGRRAVTGRRGVARVRVRLGVRGERVLRASAGDTFVAAAVRVGL